MRLQGKRKGIQKLMLWVVTLAMMLTTLCSNGVVQPVQAAQKVKIELNYVYVNTKGDNSFYVDTKYVKAGTTWGDFFSTYQKCYENGTLSDANTKNHWEVAIQNCHYQSDDDYASMEIRNFNQYKDCALATFYGYPSNYKHGFISFGYYEYGKIVDSGTGWDLLLPEAYAYGSDKALAYVKKNKSIYSYIDEYCKRPGVTVKIEAPREPSEGLWDGYNVIIKLNPKVNVTKKTLTVGKSFTLKMVGTKAKSWTSSKKSVATVSSKGKVTAKKAGTTTITCKGTDGKTYKCKITVKAK